MGGGSCEGPASHTITASGGYLMADWSESIHAANAFTISGDCSRVKFIADNSFALAEEGRRRSLQWAETAEPEGTRLLSKVSRCTVFCGGVDNQIDAWNEDLLAILVVSKPPVPPTITNLLPTPAPTVWVATQDPNEGKLSPTMWSLAGIAAGLLSFAVCGYPCLLYRAGQNGGVSTLPPPLCWCCVAQVAFCSEVRL